MATLDLDSVRRGQTNNSLIVNQPNLAHQLYSQALASAFSFGVEFYDPDFSERSDHIAWRKMMLDPRIRQAVSLRLNKVAGLDWTLEPADDTKQDKRATEILTDLLHQIPQFCSVRKNIAMAIFRGISFNKMFGSRKPRRIEGRNLDLWTIDRIQQIDKRRMRFFNDKGKMKLQIFSLKNFDWIDVPHPEVYIKFVYDNDESRLGYGRGLSDSLYKSFYIKQTLLNLGVAGLEKWANGLLIVKTDFAKKSDTVETRKKAQRDLIKTLNIMRTRHVMGMGKEDDVQLLIGGNEGGGLVLEFIRYLDDSILSVALGSVLPFGSTQQIGSMARSQTESDTTEDLVQSDQRMLSEIIDTTIIKTIWDANRIPLARLGLSGVKPPRFSIVMAKPENPSEAINVISTASQLGLPMKLSEVREKLGLTRPSDDDEIFEPAPLPAQQPLPAGL